MTFSIRVLTILFILLFFTTNPAFANSDYVLPYPSVMPGSIWYKAHILLEEVSRYWYFGSFGESDYNLKQSDKYLVEARTLFEYNQYLLAYKALQKSNIYFQKIYPSLIKAKEEKKEIDGKVKSFQSAAAKHIEVILLIRNSVPKEVVWRPEKESSTILDLYNLFSTSINIRTKVL